MFLLMGRCLPYVNDSDILADGKEVSWEPSSFCDLQFSSCWLERCILRADFVVWFTVFFLLMRKKCLESQLQCVIYSALLTDGAISVLRAQFSIWFIWLVLLIKKRCLESPPECVLYSVFLLIVNVCLESSLHCVIYSDVLADGGKECLESPLQCVLYSVVLLTESVMW